MENEGRFEISDLHQNANFFSNSLNAEDQQLETVSDGAISSLRFPKRSRSACECIIIKLNSLDPWLEHNNSSSARREYVNFMHFYMVRQRP